MIKSNEDVQELGLILQQEMACATELMLLREPECLLCLYEGRL